MLDRTFSLMYHDGIDARKNEHSISTLHSPNYACLFYAVRPSASTILEAHDMPQTGNPSGVGYRERTRGKLAMRTPCHMLADELGSVLFRSRGWKRNHALFLDHLRN